MGTRRYHIVIASLLFAVLMWGSVTLGDDYQISLDIPLIAKNIPDGKALKGSIPKTVMIRLKGTGWRIVSMVLSGTPQCVLNVSSLATSNLLLTKAYLLDNIVGTSGLQAIDVNIDTLVVGFDRYTDKKVRVEPNIVVDCPEGYGVVGQLQFKPDSVVLSGAESVLRTIDSWKTRRQVFSNVRESFSTELPLEQSHNYSFYVPQKSVNVYVNVQPFAEKTLIGLTVEAHSVPPNREIIFIPPKVDLIVRGGIDQLASLSNNDFRLSIDYQSLLTDTTGFVQPNIESPSNIRILLKRPERLQYIIRKRL